MRNLRLAMMSAGAVVLFHLAQIQPRLAFLLIPFFLLLFYCAQCAGPRLAFYTGLMIGVACYAPHLSFFFTLFGGAAILLWLILALFPALFMMVAQRALDRGRMFVVALPFVWCGLEYFRSELYYLRFSWLSPGFIVPAETFAGFHVLGSYGVGFVLVMLAAAAWVTMTPKLRAVALMGAMALFALASSIKPSAGEGE